MQSVILYGRLVARAFVSGVTDDFRQISWTRQQTQIPLRPLSFLTASSGISKSNQTPKIVSKWSFGDDAYFVAKNSTADVIGVADGVGGWRSYGVDPSVFPCNLMSTCERLVKTEKFRPQEPVDILSNGYNEILENKSQLIGSCTACLVSLHKEDQTLYTANLGDSGFRVIRKGDIVHKSEEQQHYFNTPFQLAVAPNRLQGTMISDSPDSAATSSFTVEEGDLVLVGTDGLFDNLSDAMILRHIRDMKGHKLESVQCVANSLAHQAHTLAFDPDYMSPFAINAVNNGYNVSGGKPDDITVVLARITDEGLDIT